MLRLALVGFLALGVMLGAISGQRDLDCAEAYKTT